MPASVKLHIKIEGMDEARERFKGMRDGVQAVKETIWLVGSNAPYAGGIETGRTQSGRTARAAGGLFFLQAGKDAAQSRLPEIAEAVFRGPEAVFDAGAKVAHVALAESMAKLSPFPYSPRTRRRTGNLRRSLHTVSARSR